MIPERIIEKAIEGGWKSSWRKVNVDSAFIRFTTGEFNVRSAWMLERVALDPLFWSSLGKALGWNKKMVIRRGTVIGNFCCPPSAEIRGECFEEMGFGMDYLDPQIYYTHRFYDLILNGGDTDAYWQELLAE